MKTKLKSFTLSEMLVVLIITAIIVGMAFSVISLVRKQVNTLKVNTENQTKVELLESKLYINFNKYAEIQFTEKKGFVCKNEVDSTFFIIKDNLIISDQDTLTTKLKEVKAFYKNEIVKQGRVDALEVILNKDKKGTESIFVYKVNDAQEFNEISLNGI